MDEDLPICHIYLPHGSESSNDVDQSKLMQSNALDLDRPVPRENLVSKEDVEDIIGMSQAPDTSAWMQKLTSLKRKSRKLSRSEVS